MAKRKEETYLGRLRANCGWRGGDGTRLNMIGAVRKGGAQAKERGENGEKEKQREMNRSGKHKKRDKKKER